MEHTTNAPLTLENLKRLCIPFTSQHPTSPSSISEGDSASLFSGCERVLSSTSSAPEDEEAPYTVQSTVGEHITVYQSLEQAVRYSLLRVEQERRSEEETRRFAYASLPLPLQDAASTTPVAEAGLGHTEVDEDEDAYFSMG